MAFEDMEEHRSPGLDDNCESWSALNSENPSFENLYGELQVTAEKCKNLATKLQKVSVAKVDKGVQTNGCCEGTKAKLMQSTAENLRLRQNLKDVSEINHRWQSYNSDRQNQIQHLLATVFDLRQTINALEDARMESLMAPAKSDSDASGDQSDSDNQRLTREVQVLSQQLKESRDEARSLAERLQKTQGENEDLKETLKSYEYNLENENTKKGEALNEARKVAQELCVLKANCLQQAEKLMKLSTTTFSCSLCQGPNMKKTLNDLNSGQSQICNKPESRECVKKIKKLPAYTIIQDENGVEVRLQERSPGSRSTDVHKNKCPDQVIPEKPDPLNPIITFPDSDSEEHISITKNTCSEPVITTENLMCPLCAKTFLREQGRRFLDHYTKCKISPSSSVS